MSNFTISFSEPLFLLALIPALALTFYTYFRLSRKYRKTRNRIISVVLHILITVMATCMLAGLTFKYNVQNEGNYVLFLVDVSDTTDRAEKARDKFVEVATSDCELDGYNVAVVTFGYNQVYAAPMTDDSAEAYNNYISAEKPDTTATDIASALTYAKNLLVDNFTPSASKIVLVTDGRETDGEALAIIRSIVSTGIKINTVYLNGITVAEGNAALQGEVQVQEMIFPDKHIDVDEDFELKVLVKSKEATKANIILYDNGEKASEIKGQNLPAGEQEVKFMHKYEKGDLHELECVIEVVDVAEGSVGDVVTQNNRLIAYQLVESFNNVLILQSQSGQSKRLEELLKENKFEVTVRNIDDTASLPKSVNEMRQYDQVIMNNIAYADMTEDFVDILFSYVYDYGGNMLTVGGLDETGEKAHSYNRADIMATKYQDMLPVQVVEYTPPVAAVIIIDVSGSMSGARLESAKEGARTCARNALDEKDRLGIITLTNSYDPLLPMTPVTDRWTIEDAINKLTVAAGGTSFGPAFEQAAKMLNTEVDVDKRHIVVVSDGDTTDASDFAKLAEKYYQSAGITVTVVLIDSTPEKAASYQKLLRNCGGNAISADSNNLITEMREDVQTMKIPALQRIEEGYNPKVVKKDSDVLKGITFADTVRTDDYLTFKLYGYFGVKAKNSDDTVLSSMYGVPLYSQWRFGKGSVGSFMCDLDGNWSKDLFEDPNGNQLIINIVKNLMPIESIRPWELDVTLSEDNYTNRLSITTPLNKGERIEAEIEIIGTGEVIKLNQMPADNLTEQQLLALPCYVKNCLSADSDYSNCTFVIKESGIYKITVKRVDASGADVCEPVVLYKTFSYSAEYDEFMYETVDLKDSLLQLANKAGGSLVEDNENPVEILEGFVTELESEYDPRYLFAILCIVLFLLDIVVRKFKFKWIHEIVRDRKLAKESEMNA